MKRWLAGVLAALLLGCALAEGGANLSADAVYHLELRLESLGYFDGKSDSTFDQETRTALLAFQQANGLEPSGEVDAATLDLLNGDEAVDREAYLESFAQRAASMASIRQGDTSAEVKLVQSRLKVLGFFTGKADGAFGDATRQAVERFQMANGLEQTGEVDGPTQVRLSAEAPITWGGYLAEMSSSPGDTGLSVYALQLRLREMGFFLGECTAAYGEMTRQAVEAFQRANGLEVTGVADAATWSRLSDEDAVALRKWDELQRGDIGEKVEQAQERLTELGYLVDAPGEGFDYITETAVRLFQMGSGLAPTGGLNEDAEHLLLSEDALPADDARVAKAWQARVDAANGDTRSAMAAAARELLGARFGAARDDLYPGFAFVQYICAAAGLPVLQPETLAALADARVDATSEVNPGDIVAFQSAAEDSVSVRLAIGAGAGKIYTTTADGGWVVLEAMDQLNSTSIYRWDGEAGGEK